jgi:hypothetical protein
MSWLITIVVVLVGVAVFIYLASGFYQTTYSDDFLAELRKQNANLRRRRFGPDGPNATGAWHRVLSADEQRIVRAGEGLLLGLRQVALVEDERGRHWRVVVAHEKGSHPLSMQKNCRPKHEGMSR